MRLLAGRDVVTGVRWSTHASTVAGLSTVPPMSVSFNKVFQKTLVAQKSSGM